AGSTPACGGVSGRNNQSLPPLLAGSSTRIREKEPPRPALPRPDPVRGGNAGRREPWRQPRAQVGKSRVFSPASPARSTGFSLGSVFQAAASQLWIRCTTLPHTSAGLV